MSGGSEGGQEDIEFLKDQGGINDFAVCMAVSSVCLCLFCYTVQRLNALLSQYQRKYLPVTQEDAAVGFIRYYSIHSSDVQYVLLSFYTVSAYSCQWTTRLMAN